MHKALYPWDDIDRLYVWRKEGGSGLASIEDSVDASIQRLEDYIRNHEGGLLTAIKNDTANMMTSRMTITWKQKWEEQLYGRFKRPMNNISHEKTWTWLRKGNFKKETESLLTVAQNNAIRTNQIKPRIDMTDCIYLNSTWTTYFERRYIKMKENAFMLERQEADDDIQQEP